MHKHHGPVAFVCSLLLAFGLTGVVAFQEATPVGSPAASTLLDVPLIDVAGEEAGNLRISETDEGMLHLLVTVEGLPPGDHGIHIHEVGMCDPSGLEPFSTAGSHYNPTGGMHGTHEDPTAHAGDLENITIGEDGTGTLEVMTDRFTLDEGPTSLFDADGSSIIIHAEPDDLMTDPTGLSGGRVMCGVIAEPAMPMASPEAVTLEGVVLNPEQLAFSDELLNQLTLPDGFEISVFAQGLTNPRKMYVVTEGVVLVSQPEANQVSVLRDTDLDGEVDESEVVASNLPVVHGFAQREGQLYLAGEQTIWVVSLSEDGTLGTPEVLVDDLPEGGQHGRNTLAFGPDGMLYVSIGSTCNVCMESNEENATILRMNADGSEREIYASGLRNTLGWAWHPDTGDLWGMDQGSDWRGNDQPPEELNLIQQHGNYGWPFCFGEQEIDVYAPYVPSGSTAEQYCDLTEAPVLTYQAHSSPIGLVFYTGDQFPADYQGDAFVAMRGSWNREPVTGYKVVHIQFENGEPVAMEDFITGWLSEDGSSHFGRIAGLALLPDGSMLIAEDTNGVVYRVTYTGNGQ